MRILIIIGCAMLLFSCSKNRTLHISAKNAATGNPYSGLTYYVVEEKTGSNGEKYKTVATGELDANGEKMVDVKIRKNRSYTIRVEEPPNWIYNKEISYSYAIQDDPNPQFEFQFAESAYLKLNINNINCLGSTDTMHFRSKQSYTEWQSFSSDRIGCYSYQSPDYFQIPEGWRIYNWIVTRNGVNTEFTDSIYVGAGQQGVFNMNY